MRAHEIGTGSTRIRRARLAWLIAVASAPACAFSALSGKVVNIADGDTLTVLIDQRPVKVRLADIDAPEKRQAFGARSRQSLAQLCFQKSAELNVVNRDRYGRTVATVACDGVDANAEQIRRGMAWVYDRYASPRSPLYGIQAIAKEAHLGLWIDPSPIPPWIWRRQSR